MENKDIKPKTILKSIILDGAIYFIPLVIYQFLVFPEFLEWSRVFQQISTVLSMLWMAMYFTSDYFLNGRSLGKRVMGLVLVSKSGFEMKIDSVFVRKLYETFLFLVPVKGLKEKVRYVDRKTKTSVKAFNSH